MFQCSISPAAFRLPYLDVTGVQVISWPFVLLSPEAESVSWRRFIKSSRLPPAAHADLQINLYPLYLPPANTFQRRQLPPQLYEVAFRKCLLILPSEAPQSDLLPSEELQSCCVSTEVEKILNMVN